MGIGTSLGAFHEDEFAHVASPWMEKPEDTPDNNVIDPTVDPESTQPITNLILPVANITNTPGEIMEGLEGTKIWPQGYGSRGGSYSSDETCR